MGQQYQTMDQIKNAFTGEWVLVDVAKRNHNGFAAGGTVVAHGTDKEKVIEEMDRLPIPRNVAFFYAGPFPEDAIFIL